MATHFLDDLRATFAIRGRQPALVHRGRSVSYAELEARANRVAARLQQAGVEPGDRVGVCVAEKETFLVAHLGVLFAGAAVLPLNPGLTRDELHYFLDDSEAKGIVADGPALALATELRAELPTLREVLPPAALDAAASFRTPSTVPTDPCLLIYSSGTTGRPKGVVHTHANTASALHALRDCWRMTADDVVVNVLPLFHVHGLCFATHLTWLAGGCVRLEDRFEPLATLDAVGRGTVLMAVPTIYYRFLEQSEFRDAARSW
jgi:malonyl-CoA/methylmalonyl-CoA synthetase